MKICFTFALPKQRELSSAGLEHLPYKQGVIGSIPIAPTKRIEEIVSICGLQIGLQVQFSEMEPSFDGFFLLYL